MGPSGRFTHVMIYWTVWDRYMQVFYLGRAPHTKETLPEFCEKCWVTRHSRVFRGLIGSQRTPGFGASHKWSRTVANDQDHSKCLHRQGDLTKANKVWFYFINSIFTPLKHVATA